jgi:hypothetical protein
MTVKRTRPRAQSLSQASRTIKNSRAAKLTERRSRTILTAWLLASDRAGRARG